MDQKIRRKPLNSEPKPPERPPRPSETGKNPPFATEQASLVATTQNLSLQAAPELEAGQDPRVQEPLNTTVLRSPTSTLAAVPSEAGTLTVEQSKWRTALEVARHFAGGLLAHPVESTKHYSILRHSHGLVYYKGPSTSIAITIFADQPLPAGRTLWLQNKGWSGKTGLKVGALFGKSNGWIDVTPAEKASASQLPTADERAWQRDISKFLKKAPKELRHHKVRETAMVRIPAVAEDGYFRIVLCTAEGKKTLCPSPVFRLASTSTSGSSIRGASLSTLPFEIGVNILSTMANTATANTLAPVTESVV